MSKSKKLVLISPPLWQPLQTVFLANEDTLGKEKEPIVIPSPLSNPWFDWLCEDCMGLLGLMLD